MNKTIQTTLQLFLGALILLNISSCQKQEKPVKFIIASDFHAPDIPDGKERLASFIEAAHKEKADFIIELGDFCRLDSASQVYHELWNSFPKDKYHVIGNHDMDQYTPEEYVKGMNMPGRYYSFDKGDFHFIVLDGNNLYDGKEYRHYAKANYYVNPEYRAFIDPGQMEWLKKDLASTNKRCILFSHQSIDTFVKNGNDVRQILENENERAGFKKIVLAFSGHNHSNYSKVINGITYIQINSASYVWIDQPSKTELRYPEEVNKQYPLLGYSITYDRPLYATVTLTKEGADIQGEKANFLPPTPEELGMKDSIGAFPLVSVIEDAKISF